MKKLALTIFITIIAVSIFSPVQAADISDAFNETSSSVLSQTAEGAGFFQDDSNNINNLTQTIINTVLSFLGVIFTIIIIYAGIKWMTAEGNPESITKAKGMLKNAVIGLIIVLAAYAISVAIFSFFINASPTLDYNQ
jgi:type IV secretory pathway VirB2 component (pilin)